MFDIGFTELLLVGLVALIVLGPERLPGAARTAGLWIGRIKRSFLSIKTEVEREIGADEIRRQLHNESILDMERKMKESLGLESMEKVTLPPGTPTSREQALRDAGIPTESDLPAEVPKAADASPVEPPAPDPTATPAPPTSSQDKPQQP